MFSKRNFCFTDGHHTLYEIVRRADVKFPVVVWFCGADTISVDPDEAGTPDRSIINDLLNGSLLLLERQTTIQFARLHIEEFKDVEEVKQNKGEEFYEMRKRFVGEDILIPMHYPGQLTPINRSFRRQTYQNMSEIINDTPQYIRVDEDVRTMVPENVGVNRYVQSGTRLQIQQIIKVAGVRYVVCLDSDKTTYTFNENITMRFSALPSKKTQPLNEFIRLNGDQRKIVNFLPVSEKNLRLPTELSAMLAGPVRVMGRIEKTFLVSWIKERNLNDAFNVVVIPESIQKKTSAKFIRGNKNQLSTFTGEHFPRCSDSTFIQDKTYFLQDGTKEMAILSEHSPFDQTPMSKRKITIGNEYSSNPCDKKVNEGINDTGYVVLKENTSDEHAFVQTKAEKPVEEIKNKTYWRSERDVDEQTEKEKNVEDTAECEHSGYHNIDNLDTQQSDDTYISPKADDPEETDTADTDTYINPIADDPEDTDTADTDTDIYVSPEPLHDSELQSSYEGTITQKAGNEVDDPIATDTGKKTEYLEDNDPYEEYDIRDNKHANRESEYEISEENEYARSDDIVYENTIDDRSSTHEERNTTKSSKFERETDRRETNHEERGEKMVNLSGFLSDSSGEHEYIGVKPGTGEDQPLISDGKSFFNYNVQEVIDCFRTCALEKMADVCECEHLDGVFFKHIDKCVLKDDPFNLNSFEMIKYDKTVNEGWRPK